MQPEQTHPRPRGFRRRLLGDIFHGVKRYLILGVAATLCATFLTYVTPLVVSFTVDSVIGDKTPELPAALSALFQRMGGRAYFSSHIWVLASLVVLVTLLGGVFTYLRGHCIAFAGEGLAKRLRDRLFTHLEAVPYSYHVGVQTGDLVQRCTSDVETVRRFVQMQAMDPSEVRAALARSEEFMVEDILDDQDEDWGLSDIGPDLSGVSGNLPPTLSEPSDTVTGLSTAQQPMSQDTPNQDGAGQPTSAATLVVKDGKILVGARLNGEGICGPGGHIEDGETPEQAARREALEEFGIQLGPVYCLGQLDGLPEEYGLPVIFLCTDFAGEPVCDGSEMQVPDFLSFETLHNVEEISEGTLFPPFRQSLQLLVDVLCGGDAS